MGCNLRGCRAKICNWEVVRMTTDAQRRAKLKYDKDNFSYQTVKVPRITLETFKALCAEHGDKVNTVLREAMENYIAEHTSRE